MARKTEAHEKPPASKDFTLDRRKAFPALIGDPSDALFIAGLAGTAKDVADICGKRNNYYALAGVMGGAVSMGLGLALAQPKRRVIVATGDGELLMNVGSLAVCGVMNPPNLAIVCVDNGHYGETGYQKSHTSQGVDLEQIAMGSGIRITRTVSEPGQIGEAARLLRQSNGVSFILLRVAPTPPPSLKRDLDAGRAKDAFRTQLLGA